MTAFIPDGPVSADDPAYQAAIAAEAAFWADPAQSFPIADALAAAPVGPFKRHHNRRLGGSETRPWFHRIADRGPFKRGLVLGSGSTIDERRILQGNPGVHLTFCDIDTESLARRQRMFDEQFPGRVTVQQMDLNFVELDRNAYDLIISVSTIHHVVNLEWLAAQINGALTADGWFFLHDFTGASGFRFPAAQKRIFEAVYARERARRPDAGLPDPNWQNADNYATSPFEAVRSADIVETMAANLDEIERHHSGTILMLPMFCDILRGHTPPPPRRSRMDRWLNRPVEAPRIAWETLLSEECITELCLLDDLIIDAGMFSPINTFGIYKKKV